MLFLRLEVLCFIASFLYIVYYFGDKVFSYYRSYVNKKQEKLRIKQEREERKNSKKITPEQESQSVSQKPRPRITQEQSEKLREISKRAQVNISRGYYESARILIIEGLTLRKEDKELNLLLADVYEREKNYKNAAYIYNDMLEKYEEDDYILQRLGNIYALLGKNKKSFEIYQIAHKKNRSNIEILDILSHLALELKDFKKSLKYTNMFLKEKPRNAEKLSIRGFCLEKTGKTSEAMNSYRRVLEIQPYNTEVQERLQNLEK